MIKRSEESKKMALVDRTVVNDETLSVLARFLLVYMMVNENAVGLTIDDIIGAGFTPEEYDQAIADLRSHGYVQEVLGVLVILTEPKS